MEGATSSNFPKLEISISAPLLAKRNLIGSQETLNYENVPQALLSLKTIQLDRENIIAIGGLEEFRAIHSLYLQHNRIKKIEKLECLTNLRFLTLAWNQISLVENLKPLHRLGFLDLSHNLIKQLDVGELPPHLVILNLTGNQCTRLGSYRQSVIGALPSLQELDGETIPGRRDSEGEQEEKNDPLEDSDYESEDEDWLIGISSPLNVEKDFFAELHEDMIGRSKRRQQDALRDHKARMEEIAELQTQMGSNLHSKEKIREGSGGTADSSEELKPHNLIGLGLQQPVRSRTDVPSVTKSPVSRKSSSKSPLPAQNSKELQPSRSGSQSLRRTMEAGHKTPPHPAIQKKTESDAQQVPSATKPAAIKPTNLKDTPLKTEKQRVKKESPAKPSPQAQKGRVSSSPLKSKIPATGQKN